MKPAVKHQTRHHPDHPNPEVDKRQIDMFETIGFDWNEQFLANELWKHELITMPA